jgi:hypothetical protein
MQMSDRYVAPDGRGFSYDVQCSDVDTRVQWSATVSNSDGTVLLEPTGTIHGLSCNDPFARTAISAAVVDAINEHLRFQATDRPKA